MAAASAGRVARHESAVSFALEYGSTQNVAPASALVLLTTMAVSVTGFFRCAAAVESGWSSRVPSAEQAASRTAVRSAPHVRARDSERVG